MARKRQDPEPAFVDPNAVIVDDDEFLSEDEVAQAEVGSLFKIQGDQFKNVEWSIHRYRLRRELTGDQGESKEEWVADMTGELKGSELLPIIGGGDFRFRGYVRRADGGVKLKYNEKISLAGPRKDFTFAPTPAVVVPTPVASPSSNGVDPILAQLITRMDARLDRLEHQPATPATTIDPIAVVTSLVGALGQMNALMPKPVIPIAPEKQAVADYLQVLNTGIALGSQREPVDGDSDSVSWPSVIKEGLPILNRMVDVASRRAAAAAGRPMSEATVIDNGSPSGASPPPSVSHRWMTAIEIVADSIARQEDPDEVAGDLERVLSVQELGELRQWTLEQLNEKLAPAGEFYPILKTEGGQEFIRALHAEIKKPPEAEIVQ